MLTIAITNLADVLAWLNSLPDALRGALLGKSQALADNLQAEVQEKLSGEILQSRTGVLRDSIENKTEENGDAVGASVFVSGDVPYAAIQEYGGVTKAHIIEATNGKVLSFSMGGKQAFFTRVNHPGSTIPERSYLRSSLDDMADDIVGGLADEVGNLGG